MENHVLTKTVLLVFLLCLSSFNPSEMAQIHFSFFKKGVWHSDAVPEPNSDADFISNTEFVPITDPVFSPWSTYNLIDQSNLLSFSRMDGYLQITLRSWTLSIQAGVTSGIAVAYLDLYFTEARVISAFPSLLDLASNSLNVSKTGIQGVVDNRSSRGFGHITLPAFLLNGSLVLDYWDNILTSVTPLSTSLNLNDSNVVSQLESEYQSAYEQRLSTPSMDFTSEFTEELPNSSSSLAAGLDLVLVLSPTHIRLILFNNSSDHDMVYLKLELLGHPATFKPVFHTLPVEHGGSESLPIFPLTSMTVQDSDRSYTNGSNIPLTRPQSIVEQQAVNDPVILHEPAIQPLNIPLENLLMQTAHIASISSISVTAAAITLAVVTLKKPSLSRIRLPNRARSSRARTKASVQQAISLNKFHQTSGNSTTRFKKS